MKSPTLHTTEIERLCIGGPYAGHRLSGPASGFSVLHDHEKMQYVATFFHTSDGDVSFWIPEGQTDLQTMDFLVAAYEKKETRLA